MKDDLIAILIILTTFATLDPDNKSKYINKLQNSRAKDLKRFVIYDVNKYIPIRNNKK